MKVDDARLTSVDRPPTNTDDTLSVVEMVILNHRRVFHAIHNIYRIDFERHTLKENGESYIFIATSHQINAHIRKESYEVVFNRTHEVEAAQQFNKAVSLKSDFRHGLQKCPDQHLALFERELFPKADEAYYPQAEEVSPYEGAGHYPEIVTCLSSGVLIVFTQDSVEKTHYRARAYRLFDLNERAELYREFNDKLHRARLEWDRYWSTHEGSEAFKKDFRKKVSLSALQCFVHENKDFRDSDARTIYLIQDLLKWVGVLGPKYLAAIHRMVSSAYRKFGSAVHSTKEGLRFLLEQGTSFALVSVKTLLNELAGRREETAKHADLIEQLAAEARLTKHAEVFGLTYETATKENLNLWLQTKKGTRFPDAKKLDIVDAMKFFKKHWKLKLICTKSDRSKSACSLAAPLMDNNKPKLGLTFKAHRSAGGCHDTGVELLDLMLE